jgi:hypothetical protein
VKLRDFDLDAPNEDPLDRLRFRDETRCIAALYTRCLSPVTTRTAWKMLIECVKTKSRDNVQDLLGVLTCEVESDVRAFLLGSVPEKKKATLEILHRGVLEIAKRCDLPAAPFEEAYAAVIHRHYVNEWTWRKPVYDATRRCRAFVRCEHEVEFFRATLIIEGRDGTELARTVAFTERPHEFSFVPMLGKLRWQESTAVLEDDSGNVVCRLRSPSSPPSARPRRLPRSRRE